MNHSSEHLGCLYPDLNLVVNESSEDQRYNLLLQVVAASSGAAKENKVVEDNRLEEVKCCKASPPASELRCVLDGGKSRCQGGQGERDS